jgi:tungstate transport system substrate-binding protein
MRELICVCTAFVIAGCTGVRQPALVIATTTSVQNSGLLEVLLPSYRAATVNVHATGSGRALEMLADGEAAFVISHAPRMEQQLLATHPAWRYQKIAYNHFVVVGPSSDPARVGEARDAVTAFQRIAKSGAGFVSRGDQSGTHEREQELWAAAGIVPGDWLLTSGRGMALALRHADDKQAYTLSDQATFWQLEQRLSLKMLFADDPRLINTYAMLYRADDAEAEAFAHWLNDIGRRIIADFRVQGRPGFTVWPANCAADKPAALPCR